MVFLKKNKSQSQLPIGFKNLLDELMKRRWYITSLVLCSFILIIGCIFFAVAEKARMSGEWKELLLLLLGAFIGSYGKIIDYWFSDTSKDKILVQKMDEEDGKSLSITPNGDGPMVHVPPISINSESKKIEIDEDGDGIMDGYDINNDGKIDEYFAHRQCEHVWGDSEGDGELECLKCGKIKDTE